MEPDKVGSLSLVQVPPHLEQHYEYNGSYPVVMWSSLQDMLEEHAKKLEQRKDSVAVLDPSCLQWTPSAYPLYT